MTAADPPLTVRSPTERALAIVRASNRALIRASDEQALLEAICRIAVELGAYRLAWVGRARADPAKSVQPVAFAGHEAGYLSAIRVSWADEAHGRGPVGTAIRTGQPVVVNRIGVASFAPWRAEAAARGYASVLAVPLRDGAATFGVLALYAAEPDAFGPPEVELLNELSDDLGFGIATLRARAERERLAAVVEQAVESIVIVDAARLVAYANPAILAATSQTLEGVVGRPAMDLAREILGPDRATALIEASRRRQPWLGELDRRRPDGNLRHLEVSLTPLHDARGTFAGEVIVSRDVTALRDAEAELEIAAHIQTAQVASLRRMPNEATLEQAAQALCDELVTLPFIDIAGVEAFVNGKHVRIVGLSAPDWLPIKAGDELPPELAFPQRDLASDTPWAIAVTPEAEAPFMATLAAHGLMALAYGPLLHGGHLDGGLIVATSDERFARTLVDQMPGVVRFSATTSALLAERLHARRREVELRETLDAVLATGAFRPVFQPIVDLASRHVVGYEALTRFASGQAPDHCFADAWSVGLGPQLELATLAAALDAAPRLPAGRWLDLNVSPRLLLEPDRIRELLCSRERPLILEVTEHEPVADYMALRAAIATLGPDIRLAVDDAGAGAANFAHIVELRADLVKLDISLVRGVNRNLGRQAMVVGMRHFSQTAGCRLVAEGIETKAEARTLASLGVEFGQGYLFGRAEPVTLWSSSLQGKHPRQRATNRPSAREAS